MGKPHQWVELWWKSALMSHLILHFQLFSPQGGKKKNTWWLPKHQIAQIAYLKRKMTLYCVHLWHNIYLPTWLNLVVRWIFRYGQMIKTNSSFKLSGELWAHCFLFLLIVDINFRGVDLIIFWCYLNVLIVYAYLSCGIWSLIDTLLCHGSK